MTRPTVVRTRKDLRERTGHWKAAGETIGVVPTMGALHEGHLSLVRAARSGADRVIVTIFVNPRQFDNPEDLAKYPRGEARDLDLLAPFGVDLVYAPPPEEIYPPGFSTTVSVGGLTDCLCGASRPGHFDGVATVVTKLLNQTSADRAWFGEKDYQQLLVVRRLVADLDMTTEIVGGPTVREADGLALSSRNFRLSEEARGRAPALYRELRRLADALSAGGDFAPLRQRAIARLEEAGFERIDYLDFRAEVDLSALGRADRAARLFAAAWIDGVRLIDNVPVPPAGEAGPAGAEQAGQAEGKAGAHGVHGSG